MNAMIDRRRLNQALLGVSAVALGGGLAACSQSSNTAAQSAPEAAASSADSGYKVLVEKAGFPEGPVILPDGTIVFVEILGNKLTYVKPDGSVTSTDMPEGPNGAALGPDGALYVMESGGTPGNTVGGHVKRADMKTGEIKLLYDHVGDHKLQGPNDVVFDEWGDFWFTDFFYGALYWAKADGSEIKQAAYPVEAANGIGLSPDGRTLYVAKNKAGELVSFQISGRGQLAMDGDKPAMKTLAKVDGVQFDSLKVEESGNVSIACWEAGIITITPDGQVLPAVKVPGLRPTNIVFGGPDRKTAYITALNADSFDGKLISMPWPRAGLKLRY